MKDYVETLKSLLESSVKKSCAEDTGCIYSSGIDSALIAFIASKYCKIRAYTVGGRDSEDIKYAEKSVKDAPLTSKQ